METSQDSMRHNILRQKNRHYSWSYLLAKIIPIEKVGLYVPGGTAPLFSTVLMLATPAKIAGCKEIILCSPPGADGK